MASKAQRKRKMKMRQHYASHQKSVKLDNSSAEVIQMNDYKGVNGMKKKIAKIVGRIKKLTKSVVSWFKREDVKDVAIAASIVGGVGVATAYFLAKANKQTNQTIANVKRIKSMLDASISMNNELIGYMDENSTNIRKLINMMNAFWAKYPEAHNAYKEFEKTFGAGRIEFIVREDS